MGNNGQQWATMGNNGQQWATMGNNGQQWATKQMFRNALGTFMQVKHQTKYMQHHVMKDGEK
jgi:hypothetical protein